MPTDLLRPVLARDGIFNARDLGGLPAGPGSVVASKRIIRADALQRARGSVRALRDHGIVRVLDLRDEQEREQSGVFVAEGIEVQHHPVLDLSFAWRIAPDDDLSRSLVLLYQDILQSFGPRLGGAVTSIAEVVAEPTSGGATGGAVAFHCAAGKDRTGLLAALLLSTLGVDPQVIAQDYARSSAATAVQVQWLWSFDMPGGEATDADMAVGVWSARPETMLTTLAWIGSEYGDAESYLAAQGVPPEAFAALRASLLVDAAAVDPDDGRSSGADLGSGDRPAPRAGEN